MTVLNQSQIRARDHEGSNLLIIAGAGAGKTQTIAARALNIAGIEGNAGLTLITFTKKAATTLKNRFEKAQGTNHNAFIGTFHSLSWRIILQYGFKLGIDATAKIKGEPRVREWPEEIVMDEKIVDYVDQNWGKYGFKD